MDLKNIKATELCFTGNKFKKWAQARGIVKLSAELKSTSLNNHYQQSQKCGLRAEIAVIEKMKHKNWTLSFQRARTSIAEIDLIFEKQNKVVLIEVKALNNSWRAFERIDQRQTQKLQANLIYLSNQFSEFKFFAALCWVDKNRKVYFVEIS